MKKFIFTLMLAFTCCIIWAQDFGVPMGMPPGEPDFKQDSLSTEVQTMNPKEYGKQQTEILNKALTLSQEQYVTVYKIYKNEMQTLVNRQAMPSSSSDPVSMMMGNGPQMSASSNRSTTDDAEKRIEKRNRKLAKVLDAAQFNTYLQMQAKGEVD